MTKKQFYIKPETDIFAVKPTLLITISEINDAGGIDIKTSSEPDEYVDPDEGDEILSKGRNVWNDWD